MKALDYRILCAACLPAALAACPTPPVQADDDDGGTTEVGTSSTTAEPTPLPTPTTGEPTPEPMTTTTDPGTSSTTADPDSSTVDPTTGEVSVCGNNIIEGDELCDLNQLNGETCASLGYEGGVLGCLLNCEDYNLLGCFICGNEVIDIAEDCEGGIVPKEVTCTSLGFEAGWVTCGDDCLYDTSECSICGDGIQQGPEDCDGIDFGGETCMSLGFDMGNLGCNLAQCSYVYSGCSGGQYVQNFEGTMGMMPGEFTVDVAAEWFVDDADPIDGTYSARSGALPGGGITDLELTVDCPAAGDVTFDYLTSCDNGFDYLEFRIDGGSLQQWTGVMPLNTHMAALAAGQHTLQWRFNRQAFGNEGLDAVFVDNIAVTNCVPI